MSYSEVVKQCIEYSIEKMEKYYDEIVAYFVENIEDYEERCQRALSIIGKWRCSLEFADRSLYDSMNDYLEEWIEENEYDISAEDIDLEEIFWHC